MEYAFTDTIAGNLSLATSYDPVGTPTSADNIRLQASPMTGSASCFDLIDSSGTFANPVVGGTITVFGQVGVEGGIEGGVQVNGGILLGNGGTLVAQICDFETDPGGGTPQTYATYGPTIWNATPADTSTINDDGSAIWGAIAFGAIVVNGYITFFQATDFTTVNLQSINVTANSGAGATFGTIAQFGDGVILNISNNTLAGVVTWTDVTNPTTDAAVSGSRSGSTISLTLQGAGGSVDFTISGGQLTQDCTFLGTVDGDFTNPADYADLIPPESGNNLILGGTESAGTGACKNLSDLSGSFANPATGGTITVYGPLNGVDVNGATVVPPSGPLVAVASQFDTDPGNGTALTLTTSASCTINASLADSSTLNDDGSATYGPATWNAVAINTPAVVLTQATDFTNVNLTSVNVTANSGAGAALGAITQNGDGVVLNISNNTLAGVVTWTDVTNPTTDAAVSGSRSGSTISLTLQGAGGSVDFTISGGQLTQDCTFLGTVDTDFTNPANYADLIPPTDTNNLIAESSIGAGDGAANNFTDDSGSFANPIVGGTINLSGSMSAVDVNGGQILPASGPLIAVASQFDTDPGAGTALTLNTSGGCTINASLAGTSTLNDDGSATYGPATWNAVAINTPTIDLTGIAADMTATTLTSPSVTCTDAAASFGVIIQNGPDVTLDLAVGSTFGPVTWNNVATYNVTCNVITSAALSGGNYVTSLNLSDGSDVTASVPLGDPDAVYPIGNIVLDAASGGIISFGPGPNGNSIIASATVPDGNLTIVGSAAYGNSAGPITPNYYPVDAGNVTKNLHFGAGNISIGNNVIPSTSSVLNTAPKYGPNATLQGTASGGGGGSNTGLQVPIVIHRR